MAKDTKTTALNLDAQSAERAPKREVIIAERTRELIAQLDERLGSNDAEFTKLFRNFKAAEYQLRKAD